MTTTPRAKRSENPSILTCMNAQHKLPMKHQIALLAALMLLIPAETTVIEPFSAWKDPYLYLKIVAEWKGLEFTPPPQEN